MTPSAPPAAPAPLDLEALKVRRNFRLHNYEPDDYTASIVVEMTGDIDALVAEVERLREEIRRLKYLELLDAYEDEDNQEERRL